MNIHQTAFSAASTNADKDFDISDLKIKTPKFLRTLRSCTIFTAALLLCPLTSHAIQFDIQGPAGSGAFGTTVTVLSNGNIVVSDPQYDAPGPVIDVGAVYVYDALGTLISTLTGSAAGDKVGSGIFNITAINSSAAYFLVMSPNWDDDGLSDVGAVTIVNAESGLSGVVSALNSMIGSVANDRVGDIVHYGPSPMDYFVVVPGWDNGSTPDVGAVRWGNGSTVPSGPISASNALVGSTTGDIGAFVSNRRLTNGRHVLSFSDWNNGSIVDAGAVTWIDQSNPPTGAISEMNSLVGSSANDHVGIVNPLNNGNYVVGASTWDNGATPNVGASVWANGNTGIVGVISPSNAIVGTSAQDNIGSSGVLRLSNGNYLVQSPQWRIGSAFNVGALTWVNGSVGATGPISAANSLVGSQSNDGVGANVREVAGSNYVSASSAWNSLAGAVTWGNGLVGISGTISAVNSLVGSISSDRVGVNVEVLSNRNYVVGSPDWGSTDVGAVTWVNGTTGRTGTISSANSLLGSSAGERLGFAIQALTNGDYVVDNSGWDNGAIVDVGAVLRIDGTAAVTGIFSASGALVGSTADDRVGYCASFRCVQPLSDGNYVVFSNDWDNGSAVDAGAVTWVSGLTGLSGPVSSLNSLVGNSTNDRIGSQNRKFALTNYTIIQSPIWDNGSAVNAGAVTLLKDGSSVGPVSQSNSLVGNVAEDNVGLGPSFLGLDETIYYLQDGRYVVHSSRWDNGLIPDAGAMTFGIKDSPAVGPINANNSVLGTVANAGARLIFGFGAARDQFAVGRPDSNIVTLFDFHVFNNGFE